MTQDDRPTAPEWRVEQAVRMFEHTTTTPERYVALRSHTIYCSSFDECRYPDPALTAWIDEVHRLIRSGESERCRREHLTAEEYATVRADMADDLNYGL